MYISSLRQSVTSMTVKILQLMKKKLQLMKSDEQCELFWSLSNTKARALEVPEPILPLRHKRPKHLEVGNADSAFPDSAKCWYKTVYFIL